MSIYLSPDTKVIVQGITGHEGSFHTREMIAYGTNIVAGVTPGKGGCTLENVPVFDSVQEALTQTGANTSVLFVPAKEASDAMMEASNAGIELIICITEGIPIRDMTLVLPYLEKNKSVLIGPNCPGIICPSLKAKVGIMPNRIFQPGKIGIISRSGTLTYEVVEQIVNEGAGISTCAGIGGDPLIGQTFTDVVKRFAKDEDTEALVLIGEIGGNAEQEAAEYIVKNLNKPVVAFIAGRSAPAGKKMGHAGAIISGKSETCAEKQAYLEELGIICVENLADIGRTVKKLC